MSDPGEMTQPLSTIRHLNNNPITTPPYPISPAVACTTMANVYLEQVSPAWNALFHLVFKYPPQKDEDPPSHSVSPEVS